MNYEQEYNKLVNAIKVLQETNPSDEGIQNWVKDNVPELAESRDEKVRKWIYNYFRSCFPTWIHPDITCGEILDWLEKQGEKKPATIDIDKMVDDYANNKERGNEEFGKPVPCMIRAYRQGLNDAIEKVVLKSAWSEEDKKKLNRIYYLIAEAANEHAFSTTCRLIGDKECVELQDFLKSLKQRIGG